MILDLHNIPDDFDWKTAFFELNDKYHQILLEKIDLLAELQTLTNKYKWPQP